MPTREHLVLDPDELLLEDYPFATTNYPTGPVPPVLSKRFQRVLGLSNFPIGHKKLTLGELTLGEDEEEGESEDDGPSSAPVARKKAGRMNNTGVLPAIRQHGTRSSQYGPGNTASSVDRGVDGTAGGTDSDPAVADKRPAATSLLVDPEGETIPYKPFELSARSSFNPARLSRRQMERLDPHIRAKYLAYEAPPPIVARRIEESDLRVRRWSREERLRMLATMENARMIWERMHGIERVDLGGDNEVDSRGHHHGRSLGAVLEEGEHGDVHADGAENEADGHKKGGKAERRRIGSSWMREGEAGAKKAKERMQNKIQQLIAAKEAELQFLVEGQATALEAIRLKEHVGVRKMGKVQLGKVYSKRDRQRVADLLS